MGIWNGRVAAFVLIGFLMAAESAQPSFGQKKRVWKKVWTASVAVLAAVNVMDARSSVGRFETNPLLRDGQGRCSAGRTVAVKSAALGGMVLVQALLLRRMPHERLEKPSAIVNFAAAATVGAIAYRNTRVVP